MKSPERDVADYAYGNGWGEKVERRLDKIEKESGQFRLELQKLDDIKTGVNELGSKWVQFTEEDKRWKKHADQKFQDLEGAPPSSGGDEDEEFSGVTNVEELRRKGRRVRARAHKFETNAKRLSQAVKYGWPALLGIGYAVAEIIERILHR